MAAIGKRGFDSFAAKYFSGNREEATAWLRTRAAERQAETFAERELARRVENGEKVVSTELPVYSTEDTVPF